MEVWYYDASQGGMVYGVPPAGTTTAYDPATDGWFNLTPEQTAPPPVEETAPPAETSTPSNLQTNSPLALDAATEAALRQEQEQRYDLANVNPHVNEMAIADNVPIDPYMYDQSIYGGPPEPVATGDDGGGGGGYSSSRRRGGGYSRGGGGGGSGGSGGWQARGNDPMSNIPAYADGRLHPAITGQPLTPGGRWNDGDSGYSGYGRANTASGGSTNRYYRPSSGRSYHPGTPGIGRGFGWEPSPGQERVWAMRSNIMDTMVNPAIAGAMGGAAGGTTTGGTTTSGGGGGGGSGAAGPTGTRNLRGWARQQGYNPSWLQDNVYYNPEYLLPDIIPGLEPGDPMYNQLNNQLGDHIGNLWSMSAGARRNNLGDPDQYANWMNKTIDRVTTPGGQWFDRNKLMSGIFNPQAKSAQWMGRKGGDSGDQLYDMQSQLGTTAYLTMAPQAADAFMAYVDATAAKYQNMASKRKPANVPDPYKWVSRRIRPTG